MNVLAVEGRNKGRIQLDENGMGNIVALVLRAFDLLNSGGDVFVILEKVVQLAGSSGEVFAISAKRSKNLVSRGTKRTITAEESPVGQADQVMTAQTL